MSQDLVVQAFLCEPISLADSISFCLCYLSRPRREPVPPATSALSRISVLRKAHDLLLQDLTLFLSYEKSVNGTGFNRKYLEERDAAHRETKMAVTIVRSKHS